MNIKPSNALTIDVEDYFQVAAFDTNIDRSNWHSFECRVEANTEKFMEIVAAKNIKATFFILGWIAEKYPQLVKKIAAAGHEVASHGYSHKLVFGQTPGEFKEETDRSKKLLEDLTGCAVKGYRAASYSITPASIWALEIISEAGFEYDSSIYPVKHDRYGLQGGPCTPYRISLASGRRLTEFPITTVSILGYKVPVGGGGYFRIYPFELTTRLLRLRIKQSSGPFVFYLHPWELDPDQPKVQGASRLSNFRHYHNLHKVENRLEALLDIFDFGTMSDALPSIDEMPTHSYT